MIDFVSLSNVIIDDILLPDGRAIFGVLGGAGVHAMAGARVWSSSLGLIGSIGSDMGQDNIATLRNLNIDTSMLVPLQEHTTRAWQIFQPDGERIEVFRDKRNVVRLVSVKETSLSERYRNVKGVHLFFSEAVDILIENIETFRTISPKVRIILEPSESQTARGKVDLERVFPLIDVFSPNLLEAGRITGCNEPEAMIGGLFAMGAKAVALRMGGRGSLVAECGGDLFWIPATEGRLVDVTGAGNAYCGGLLVGLAEGLSLAESALRGAVSASFAMEQFGVCPFDDGMVLERNRRLQEAASTYHLYTSNGE